MSEPSKAVWITFDLGLQGDYEGLYAWLDEKGAKDCGDNVAFIQYEYVPDTLKTTPLVDRISRDLKKSVKLNKRARVYVIYIDSETKRAKGKFISGARKAPPWSGYAEKSSEIDTDE